MLLVVCMACQNSDSYNNKEANKEKAQEVIDAIESYLSDHGRFPEALSDLVPVYLPEIPKTLGGAEYDYNYVGGDYDLTFTIDTLGKTGKSCSYIFRFASWDCGIYEKH